MSKITIFIKPTATAEKITLEVETSIAVLDLKEAIALKQPIIAAEQRLIYKGQILKDERTVESYGTCLCWLSRRFLCHKDTTPHLGLFCRVAEG